MPTVLYEAMEAGVAIVATDVGGVAEIAPGDSCSLLVPPRAPEALAAAIRQALTDQALRQRLGVAGRARAAALFSPDAIVSQWEALYEELWARQGKVRRNGRA